MKFANTNPSSLSHPNKALGFTLIELLIVIIILSILAAFAVSRYMEYLDHAHNARNKATLAAFEAGMVLFNSRWRLIQEPRQGTVIEGFGDDTLRTSNNGYPIGIDQGDKFKYGKIETSKDCIDIWNGLLQELGNRPSIVALTNDLDIKAYPGDEMYASIRSVSGKRCYYYYLANGHDKGQTIPRWEYNSHAGSIKILEFEVP